eukprot:SAG31_NODE_1179_length_9530_cov_8.153748_9_plen_78_part_00
MKKSSDRPNAGDWIVEGKLESSIANDIPKTDDIQQDMLVTAQETTESNKEEEKLVEKDRASTQEIKPFFESLTVTVF